MWIQTQLLAPVSTGIGTDQALTKTGSKSVNKIKNNFTPMEVK